MATGLNDNLAVSDLTIKALAAVQFTKDKIYMGAVNDPKRLFLDPRPTNALFDCTSDMHSAIDQELAGMKAAGTVKDYWGDQLEINAKWAARKGCGNCNEQSAVAFVYLRDVLKARPLDWMAYGGIGLVGTHAFVIVGREKGTSPSRGNMGFVPSDMNTWNDSAVMCDAYTGEVNDLPTTKSILHTKSDLILRYRLE